MCNDDQIVGYIRRIFHNGLIFLVFYVYTRSIFSKYLQLEVNIHKFVAKALSKESTKRNRMQTTARTVQVGMKKHINLYILILYLLRLMQQLKKIRKLQVRVYLLFLGGIIFLCCNKALRSPYICNFNLTSSELI